MRAKVDVRDYVSQEYMALSDKEMADLDRTIEKTIKSANKELKETPWKRNDTYQQQEVVETLSPGNSNQSEEKGGED